MSDTPLRVLLVEDHEMVAGAFRAALELEPDIAVVGTAGALRAAVDLVASLRPDVAVVDYRLPDGEVGDHLEELFAAHEGVRILVVTGWASDRAVVRCVEGGVQGFLSKNQSVQDFVSAVRRVGAGEAVFAADVLARVLTHLGRGSGGATPTLSVRELEILRLLRDGMTTNEIAAELYLSVNTVRNHVAAILSKLNVRSRLEAVTEGMRLGIISSPDLLR